MPEANVHDRSRQLGKARMMEPARRHPGVEETSAALAELPTAAARIVYHLISCPWCLERALSLSIEEEGDAGEELAAVWTIETAPPASWLHSLAKQGGAVVRRCERDREAAPALLEELMSTRSEEHTSELQSRVDLVC